MQELCNAKNFNDMVHGFPMPFCQKCNDVLKHRVGVGHMRFCVCTILGVCGLPFVTSVAKVSAFNSFVARQRGTRLVDGDARAVSDKGCDLRTMPPEAVLRQACPPYVSSVV